MKIKDIISEDRKGKLPPGAAENSRSITRFRDNGGYDRTNHLNRVMMAAACHDGKTDLALSAETVDPASWVEKYNTAHPYTEQEHNMLHHAYKAIGVEINDAVSHPNKEPDTIHKVSPVTGFAGYPR
jgi:hypothetical protein